MALGCNSQPHGLGDEAVSERTAAIVDEPATATIQEESALAVSSVEADRRRNDAPSRTAIVVTWQEVGSAVAGTQFPVLVENTTSSAIAVDLRVDAQPPTGEPIEQPLTAFALPGKASRVVQLRLSDLPAQSTELPTSIRVLAKYSNLTPAGAQPTLVFTEPLAFTMDSSFASATARTMREQVRVHSQAGSVASLLTQRPQLRHRNAQNGAFAVALDTSKEGQGPTIATIDAAPLPDLATIPHAQDTDTSGGEP